MQSFPNFSGAFIPHSADVPWTPPFIDVLRPPPPIASAVNPAATSTGNISETRRTDVVPSPPPALIEEPGRQSFNHQNEAYWGQGQTHHIDNGGSWDTTTYQSHDFNETRYQRDSRSSWQPASYNQYHHGDTGSSRQPVSRNQHHHGDNGSSWHPAASSHHNSDRGSSWQPTGYNRHHYSDSGSSWQPASSSQGHQRDSWNSNRLYQSENRENWETELHQPTAVAAHTDPHRPASTDPHRPAFTDPHRPASTDPHRPASTDPHRPASTDPHRPASTDPHRPASTEPHRPASTDPHRPASTDPHRPASTEPQRSTPSPVDSIDSGGKKRSGRKKRNQKNRLKHTRSSENIASELQHTVVTSPEPVWDEEQSVPDIGNAMKSGWPSRTSNTAVDSTVIKDTFTAAASGDNLVESRGCTMCGGSDHTKFCCPKYPGFVENRPYCAYCRMSGHVITDCRTKPCRYCNLVGHSDRACKTPLYCQNCKIAGHTTARCYANRPSHHTQNNKPPYNNSGAVRCYNCHNLGHISRNCPQKQMNPDRVTE
ncbi:uncharacterized protein LOC141905999 [Tubulanus polymorphus]|uniref:uncharacterized protein LOC141905999 n=1 Tax=Tubulanus polymorphus TaxID=672921 RepID=UPI003DA6A26C